MNDAIPIGYWIDRCEQLRAEAERDRDRIRQLVTQVDELTSQLDSLRIAVSSAGTVDVIGLVEEPE